MACWLALVKESVSSVIFSIRYDSSRSEIHPWEIIALPGPGKARNYYVLQSSVAIEQCESNVIDNSWRAGPLSM